MPDPQSRPLPFKVLSLIPPMTQLNTPYPSTAYLTGFLRSRGVDAVQADLALALVLRLMSGAGLAQLREAALAQDRKSTRLNSSHTEQSRMPSSA